MPVLWIINHYAQLPKDSGGTRHFSLSRDLIPHGWTPYVIASGSYRKKVFQRNIPTSFYKLVKSEGVYFLWLRTLCEPSFALFSRCIAMFSFATNLLFLAFTSTLPRPDIIVGSTVHPLAALSAKFLAWRYRVPFIFEVRDLWPSTLVAMGVITKTNPIYFLLSFLERWLAVHASKVIVLMPGAVDYFKDLGVPSSRVVWLPNGCDLNPRDQIINSSTPGKLNLIYCGSHGPANSLDTILAAMHILQTRGIDKTKVFLRLIGDGPLKSHLQSCASDLSLSNVSFEPPVSKHQLFDSIRFADAFIVAMKPLPELYRYGISFNKLFDYFNSARPVISASCAYGDPVSMSNAGIVVPAGDSLLLANAIDHMRLMSSAERNRLGLNGRVFLESNHCYKLLALRFHNILKSLIHSDSSRLSRLA